MPSAPGPSSSRPCRTCGSTSSRPDGSLRAITPAGGFRYGGLVLGDGFVLAVREDHSGDGEPVNALVRLDLDTDNADGGSSCGRARTSSAARPCRPTGRQSPS